MAADDEMAESIAAQAVSGAANDPEVALEEEQEEAAEQAAQEAAEQGTVLPSPPVYDLESLCLKYGGLQRVYEDHGVAAEEGYFNQMEDLRFWLFDYVGRHNETAKQSFVEFEHDGGGGSPPSRLVLLGTNHLSRASADFAREVVRAERPECLVLERRLGDDSLQRFTVPEELYQETLLGAAPSLLRSGDTPVDRARSFQADRVWLEASAGWRDIGGEAALCQEFGAALVEFARQRLPGAPPSSAGGAAGAAPSPVGGPRGGTVCLGDCDLRAVDAGGMLPGLAELGSGACMPLRDLQLAQALRAALRTHARVVGVVGKDHLGGISRLLQQDPRVRVTREGMPVDPPCWLKDLEDGGKKWEREAMGGSPLFGRLAEAAERTPLGTFLSAEAVLEFHRLREETAARMRRDGQAAEPAAPVSSELGAALFRRGQAFTPPDEEALRRWLAGQEVAGQEAGDFPFENRRLRKAPPSLPSSGFPSLEPDSE